MVRLADYAIWLPEPNVVPELIVTTDGRVSVPSATACPEFVSY